LVDIIGRYRSRGLPIPVTGEVLGRAGVSESLIPRTIQALKTLDLIDDDGKPTQVLEGLRLAPEGDYKQRFAQWLNEAYADVLNYVDPATANETQLRDAFRNYQPVGQQPRMMSLFAGLYREAGIGAETSRVQRISVRGSLGSSSRLTGGINIKKAAVSASKALTVQTPLPPVPPMPPTPPSNETISDKALEYKLVDLLKDEAIGDTERSAVWTLVQYLTARSRAIQKKMDPLL